MNQQSSNEYLPMNADSKAEIEQYFKVRAAELDAKLLKVFKDTRDCYVAVLDLGHGLYNSVYIPYSLRGQGLIKQYSHLDFITIPECEVAHIYQRLGFKYEVANGWYELEEYSMIKDFYGNRKANRSKEFLMWHITRGCQIMKQNGASTTAIRAYMLHPILQGDVEFASNNLLLAKYLTQAEVSEFNVGINLIEYRKVANAYLCKPYTDDWGLKKIAEACPIVYEDVRQMLLADKTQNREDFMKYHASSHPRAKQLNKYFDNWLEYLNTLNVRNLK